MDDGGRGSRGALGGGEAVAKSRSLDALRGTAAVAVLAFHANGLFLQYQPQGDSRTLRYFLWTGVFVFFAISGYLITKPFVRALLGGGALPSVSWYARRRIARILPAYWVALFIGVMAVPVGPVTVTGVLAHATLLQSLVPGQSRALFNVAWTLSIEAVFYVLVPVAAYLLARRRARWSERSLLLVVACTAAGSLAWWIVAVVAEPDVAGPSGTAATMLADSLPACLLFFSPGIAVAVLECAPSRRYARMTAHPAILVAAGSALWVAAAYTENTLGAGVLGVDAEHLLLCASSGLLVVACLHPGRRLGDALGWLAPLGVVSYGIYLWHDIVVHFMANHGLAVQTTSDLASWLGNTAVVVVVTLPLAAMSWWLIEKPAILRAHGELPASRDRRLQRRSQSERTRRSRNTAITGPVEERS